ncbi:hypothetical protein B0H11DRAFT_1117736 [Mycena galericulata]|nr:hypothetical protein B0H11DRAFT_1117736 [Mycena galericulata]
MSSPSADPNLPAELERLVFETAAYSNPQSMPGLLLVARRVKIWIEPLLYRGLYFSWKARKAREPGSQSPMAAIFDLFDAKPASFFHDNVRSLCFRDFHPTEVIAEVLCACDATVNLTFFDLMGGPALLPILATLPLQRLSACLVHLFPDWIDFAHPLFAQITHLDILDWDDRGWDFYSGLAELPHLTHLCFSYNRYVPDDVCRGALRYCPSLEVLAIVRSSLEGCSDRALFGPLAEPTDLRTDARFVVVVVEDDLNDWKKGTLGGKDYWAVADAMVAERRFLPPGTVQPYIPVV